MLFRGSKTPNVTQIIKLKFDNLFSCCQKMTRNIIIQELKHIKLMWKPTKLEKKAIRGEKTPYKFFFLTKVEIS